MLLKYYRKNLPSQANKTSDLRTSEKIFITVLSRREPIISNAIYVRIINNSYRIELTSDLFKQEMRFW